MKKLLFFALLLLVSGQATAQRFEFDVPTLQLKYVHPTRPTSTSVALATQQGLEAINARINAATLGQGLFDAGQTSQINALSATAAGLRTDVGALQTGKVDNGTFNTYTNNQATVNAAKANVSDLTSYIATQTTFDAGQTTRINSVSNTAVGLRTDVGALQTGKANLTGGNAFSGTQNFSNGLQINGTGFNPETAFGLVNTNAQFEVNVTNFNTLTKPGLYPITGNNGEWNTALNGPIQAFKYGTLLVTSAGAGDQVYHQLYFSLQGETWQRIKFFSGASWGNWFCSVRKNVVTNRAINLFEDADNDHQFYGMGINPNVLRYQVPRTAADHVFYAGVSPITSNELMRIRGNGTVSIGNTDISARLVVFTPQGIAGLKITTGVKDTWFPFSDGNNYIRGTTIIGDSDPLDRLGLGVNPTSKLHVNGANGFSQFRLEKPYTPTSSSDANGEVGQVGWDANWTYLKVSTSPHVWKRSALSTF